MDSLALSGLQLYPVKEFDRIVEIRAQRHEHLRGRNNVTSCRSPTREIDTWQIKKDLKKKRHLEFLRRRSVSPERCGLKSSLKTKPSPNIPSIKGHSSISKSETFYTYIQNTPSSNGHPVMILSPNSSMTDGPSTSKWVNMISFVLAHHMYSSMSTGNNTCIFPSVRLPYGQNRYHWRGKRKDIQGHKRLPLHQW